MSGDGVVDANSSKIEEIRARAEHARLMEDGRCCGVFDCSDVLALVEVAEAARTLITGYSDLGHSDEYLEGGLVSNYDRDLARLEQALSKVSEGVVGV